MHFRIGPDQIALDDADQRVGAAVSGVVDRSVHRPDGAGGVEYRVEAGALYRLEGLALEFPDPEGGKAQRPRRLDLVGRGIDHRHVAAGDPGEKGDTQPDGSRPDNQRPIARLELGAADGVGTDGEEFDHGGIAQAEALGGVEIGRGHDDLLGHAAVAMDADDLEALAAIGVALAAGGALVAGQVGVDDHRIAGLELRAAVRIEHDAGELVAHDPRIFEEGVVALEDVVVGAADADVADADADPAGLQHGWIDVDKGELAGGGAGDGFHGGLRIWRAL